MFRFISSNLIYHNVYRIEKSLTNSLRLLQTLALNPNSNTSNPPNQPNPTVSYLTDKCGLPLDSAILTSKRVTITSTHNADSVLQLFKSYGFTKTQITTLITRCPSALVAKPDKTIKPKFEFFVSLGLSNEDLLKIVLRYKWFYMSSLTNTIVPTVDFLKNILQTNDNFVRCLRYWPGIVYHNVRIQMEPNVLTLRARGTPDSSISSLLTWKPRVLLLRNDLFQDSVRRADEMGFHPGSLAYVRAVGVMASVREELWEKKVDILKSFGWSHHDIMTAFKTQQYFMSCSEKKIRVMMDFYLNKLSFKASDVAKYPNLLLLSLEKRVIPRCSVLQLLLSKGVIKTDLNILRVLDTTKKAFDKRFVIKYQKFIPEIVSVYCGKKGFPTFNATQLSAMTVSRIPKELISNMTTEPTVL